MKFNFEIDNEELFAIIKNFNCSSRKGIILILQEINRKEASDILERSLNLKPKENKKRLRIFKRGKE